MSAVEEVPARSPDFLSSGSSDRTNISFMVTNVIGPSASSIVVWISSKLGVADGKFRSTRVARLSVHRATSRFRGGRKRPAVNNPLFPLPPPFLSTLGTPETLRHKENRLIYLEFRGISPFRILVSRRREVTGPCDNSDENYKKLQN